VLGRPTAGVFLVIAYVSFFGFIVWLAAPPPPFYKSVADPPLMEVSWDAPIVCNAQDEKRRAAFNLEYCDPSSSDSFRLIHSDRDIRKVNVAALDHVTLPGAAAVVHFRLRTEAQRVRAAFSPVVQAVTGKRLSPRGLELMGVARGSDWVG
jgi:hypothetical protein